MYAIMYAKVCVCTPDKSGVHTLHSSLANKGMLIMQACQLSSAAGIETPSFDPFLTVSFSCFF
jgi:hypothetical protein